MRIIGGEFRSRVLLGPEDQETRPITDRVKQSLFDILSPMLPEARVYDCFAGTGSMGLESLSRGAAHATFFEAHRPAIARLKQNIAALKVADRSTVVAGDLFKWFASTPAPAKRARVIFLDPPYRFLRERPEDLRELIRRMTESHLSPDGTIVLRHDAADQLELDGAEAWDRREYGGMVLQFVRGTTRPAQYD